MIDQELRELYQQVILDHNKSPRNFRVIEHPSGEAEGYNPLCGDNINIYLNLNDEGIIEDISFKGSGCAISKASASMMTSMLKGKTKEEAEAMFEKFHDMVTDQTKDKKDIEELGKLAVLAGVKEFPARVKCASLAWHTMINALHGEENKVTTE